MYKKVVEKVCSETSEMIQDHLPNIYVEINEQKKA
jgi:hypothetical protein